MSLALTALTALALGAWLLWERMKPAYEPRGGRGRILRNVGMAMAGGLTSFAVVTPVSLAAAALGPEWRGDWPPLVRFLTDLLILELYIYWWHRANHEIAFLWRFHRVHHYDEFLDVTSALRFHPGEMIFSALLRGSLVLTLDVSVPAILVFDALVVISAGFHHSNVSLSPGTDSTLRKLVVSPHHHRVHHIPDRHYTDSNYGTLLTVWDRFFGTFREHETVGSYGVEGEREKRLSQLFTNPFTHGRTPPGA